MIITLLGYMGSGKSIIGSDLALKLGYGFLDLDDYIERKEGSTISDIFSEKGEIYFRRIESEYLRELLDNKKSIVLALGGGTPCYGSNMERLLSCEHVITIYLKAVPETLVKRLEDEPDKRPLITHLSNRDDLMEFVSKHLFERSVFYNQASLTLITDHKPVDTLVEEIVLRLFQNSP
ncbi:MAG: shikimate kinase [Flavobacteriaceae bacterium]|nr:shikimate kinase [Bacteroidia bacterium]NNK87623.1 shikimate kinase [Flavobacteriaceae bacterium]